MSAVTTRALDGFIAEVAALVAATGDEHELTEAVAGRLERLLSGGLRLPEEFTRPAADRHVNYPLHIAADGGWSLACVVWKAGQRTPVHSHETWGVAGVYAGAEREQRYRKPAVDGSGALVPLGEQEFRRGEVTVCCTTDDDVHSVVAVGDEPTVGIHVYGGDIGVLRRRCYDPDTGAVTWFASGWDAPPKPSPIGAAVLRSRACREPALARQCPRRGLVDQSVQ